MTYLVLYFVLYFFLWNFIVSIVKIFICDFFPLNKRQARTIVRNNILFFHFCLFLRRDIWDDVRGMQNLIIQSAKRNLHTSDQKEAVDSYPMDIGYLDFVASNCFELSQRFYLKIFLFLLKIAKRKHRVQNNVNYIIEGKPPEYPLYH